MWSREVPTAETGPEPPMKSPSRSSAEHRGRDGSNRLLLISWNVPSGLSSVTRLHDTGTAASNIAITTVHQLHPSSCFKAGC